MEPSCYIRIEIIRFRNKWVNGRDYLLARWNINSGVRLGVGLALYPWNMF